MFHFVTAYEQDCFIFNIYTHNLFQIFIIGIGRSSYFSLFCAFSELTLPQFYNFLHEMERAKANMDCFS